MPEPYRRYRARRGTRGYSLVELAIVMIVIGTVIGALWIAAGQAWDYAKREEAKEAIATTVTNMRAFVGGQAGVPNLGFAALTAQLLTVNVIPVALNRGASCGGNPCADNPWGSFSGGSLDPLGTFRVCGWVLGSSTTCSAGAVGSESAFFGIALTGLAKKNCIALVETISSPTGPSGLMEVNINGANLLASGKPVQPVGTGDATTNCTSVADGSGSVTFIYRTVAPSP